MQFVLDFVKGVCKCLKKSINYICNGLQKIPDAGCFYCCKYFGKMSDGLGSIVGSCFPRPYTCCSAFTILIIATPVVWGAIGYLDGHKLNCKEPAQVGLIISILCHILNLLFIVYLAGRYGKKKHGHKKKNKDGENHDITVDHTHDLNKDQTPQSSRRKRSESQSEIRSGKKSFVFDPDNIDTNTPQLQPQTQTQTQVQSNKKAQVQAEEVNNESINIKIEEHKEYDSVLAHFARRISKDIVIWIYLAIIGFEIYWQIQCHIWIDDISPNSKCFQEAKGKNMLNALRLSMLFLWIYLSFGFSVIGLTITIRGCHQGSCNPWDLNRAFILWITCSKVDIKNSSSSGMINFETSKERFIENVKEYSEGRAKWIEKTYNLLNNLGLGGKPYKVKNIEASKKAEDPHGVSVNIRTFDQINHLNTTEANLNQNQTRNDMIESSPYERKLSSRLSKKLEAHLSIPNIKSFEKI